jgi:hypothetical protein
MPASRSKVAKSNGAVGVQAPAAPSGAVGEIVIPPPNFVVASVRVVGDTPLYCNAFPDKLKAEMRDKRLGKSAPGLKNRASKPIRDPEREFRDALYPLHDGSGYGFPAIAFKLAMIGACRYVDGIDMTTAKGIIWVHGDDFVKGQQVVRIAGKPEIEEVVVRLDSISRPPDLRYFARFFPWSCTLKVEFDADMLSLAGLVNLLQRAGRSEGVGEHRPSSRRKTGDNGTFHPEFVGEA